MEAPPPEMGKMNAVGGGRAGAQSSALNWRFLSHFRLWSADPSTRVKRKEKEASVLALAAHILKLERYRED